MSFFTKPFLYFRIFLSSLPLTVIFIFHLIIIININILSLFSLSLSSLTFCYHSLPFSINNHFLLINFPFHNHTLPFSLKKTLFPFIHFSPHNPSSPYHSLPFSTKNHFFLFIYFSSRNLSSPYRSPTRFVSLSIKTL